jgi:hypothetical protein
VISTPQMTGSSSTSNSSTTGDLTSIKDGVQSSTSGIPTSVTAGSSLTSDYSGTTNVLTSKIDGLLTTSTTDSVASAGQSQGLSRADVIALGLGIGVGLPATIATLVMCCITLKKHNSET